MFGSIFVGLSGMRAFSSGLKQISNNITNINSTGFKSSGLSFTDLFGAGGARGGQGVAIESPRLDFGQGELRQSDRDLDLAIDGGGFLVLLKDAERHFARTGSFEVNEDGFIVLAGTDYKLTVLDASGNPTAVSVAAHRTNPPQATSRVQFSGNLSTGVTDDTFTLSNIQVYDASGDAETWSVRFDRVTTAVGEWTVKVIGSSFPADAPGQTLRFIAGGQEVDPTTAELTFSAGGRSVVLDFSKDVDSFSSGTVASLRVQDVDGYAAGEISSIKVNDAGVLEITYTNEQKLALGAVTLASFDNPQDLDQRGNGLFTHDGTTGVEFLSSAHDKVGRVLSARLEASNVDLSQQFGDLILVQRGFQASSQVVSVSNDMIQQLFGIRGQG
jgi:flagellar hook protein FlgE